ncbi:transposase, partial [Burkholderia cenocepacia]|uniref:transposase n=1 Tax=Burkholderia cenocepacia TaxID=95486 RepID=UPI000FB2E8B3
MTDDFLRSHLDAMIDLRHPLAVLATRMPSAPIEASLTPLFARRERAGLATEVIDLFGTVPTLAGAGVSTAGRPRLPTWLMAGLLYLKHAYNLSYEAVCERWAENNYWQYFCGEVYFQPRLPCDPTNLGRFRQALGEAGVEALLAATIAVVANMKVIAPDEFKRVIVDSTVQEKAIAFPTDSRLLEVARAKLVQLARRAGLTLKQTYEREGKRLRRRAGGYAHAKQYKRLRRVLKRQRTRDKGKLCALHAPEVECIGKGKARQPYEFGVEASLAITEKSGLIVDARTFPGNPYDRHTLTGQLEQTRILLENVPGDPKL